MLSLSTEPSGAHAPSHPAHACALVYNDSTAEPRPAPYAAAYKEGETMTLHMALDQLDLLISVKCYLFLLAQPPLTLGH